jgi:hypothetical protein
VLLPLHLVHRFEFSPRIRCRSEVEKIVTRECIGTLELVLLSALAL